MSVEDVEKRIPLWLSSLQGDSPLLSKDEWEFIEKIHSQILQKVKAEKSNFPSDDEPLKHKLSANNFDTNDLKDNFKKVVEHLKKYSRSRDYFMRNYPDWQFARELHIRKLFDIAESLKKEREECQNTRFFGNALSLVGGALTLVGTGNPFILLGLRSFGVLTSAAVSAREVQQQQLKVKQAEKIIRDDREYFEKTWSWLSDTSFLNDAIDNINCFTLQANLKYAVGLFTNLLIRETDGTKRNNKRTEFDLKLKELLKNLILPMQLKKIIGKIDEEIADVIGILVTSSLLYRRFHPLFNLVTDSYRLFHECRIAVDVVKTGIVAATACKSSELTGFQRKAMISGMILDGISIVRLLDEIGSKHEAAECIIEAKNMLRKEADMFARLRDEI